MFTFVGISVTFAALAINSALLLSGYASKSPEAFFDEQTMDTFLHMSVVFGSLLYLLSHAILSRTILYIYYNKSTRRFLGICYNWRMSRKNLVFKPGDVQLVPDNKSIMQLLRGGYVIDNKSYHIAASNFTSTRYYNLMLGFVDS